MNRQLNLDEQLAIASLMDEYRNIHDEIDFIEERLKELTHRQETLTRDLEKTREREKDFGKLLKEKYGPGKLNTLTLEYIIE